MFRIIAIPFGWIMRGCYMLVKNYGIALFIFTLIIKLLMVPSSIKQQKSSARMARLNPKREQIMKKYANNREKQNEAMMELYNQEGVSPTGGCGSLIITYLILFAIIEVVYAPMTHISGLGSDVINSASQTVANYYNVSQAITADIPEGYGAAPTLSQRLADGTDINELLAKYNDGFKESAKISDDELEKMAETLSADPAIADYFSDGSKVSKRLMAGGTARAELVVLSVAKDYPELFDPEIAQFCDDFNYTFLGFYLGEYPSWKSVYILIPILSFLSQIAMTVVSQLMMKRNGQNVQGAKGMMGMLYAMPVISFIIAFSFPAGIGIYWIFSSVLSLAQTVILNLYFTPARMDKILAKEAKKKGRRPSIYQMALEQQKAQQGGGSLLDDLDSTEDVKLSKNERKEIERQKINDARKKLVDDDATDDPRIIEARKRMAEKYGDSED